MIITNGLWHRNEDEENGKEWRWLVRFIHDDVWGIITREANAVSRTSFVLPSQASRQTIHSERGAFHVCNRRFRAYHRRESARWSLRGDSVQITAAIRGPRISARLLALASVVNLVDAACCRLFFTCATNNWQIINNNNIAVQYLVCEVRRCSMSCKLWITTSRSRCSKRMYSPQRDDLRDSLSKSIYRPSVSDSALWLLVLSATRRDFYYAWILLFNFSLDNSQKRCRSIGLELLSYDEILGVVASNVVFFWYCKNFISFELFF